MEYFVDQMDELHFDGRLNEYIYSPVYRTWPLESDESLSPFRICEGWHTQDPAFSFSSFLQRIVGLPYGVPFCLHHKRALWCSHLNSGSLPCAPRCGDPLYHMLEAPTFPSTFLSTL